MSTRNARTVLKGPAAGFAAIVGLVAVSASAQAPNRLDVLIGFDRPPGLAEERLVGGAGGSVKYRYHLVPAIAANLPENALAGLLRNPRIVRVEEDGRVRAVGAELDAAWGVEHVGADTVHAAGNRGDGVIVAVIDSGMDYDHPDLDGNYLAGWDFVNDDPDPMDDYGHGTHVAGTIVGEDDGAGVIGVAPRAGVVALKVLDENGSGSFSDIIAALEWVVDYNASNDPSESDILVTNNSYGSSGDPGTTVEQAFVNAANQGVLHIAAAGNSGKRSGRGNNVIYPARYSTVVAVAATGQNDDRASFSSTGPAVELAAPGVGINSTLPGGGYGTKSGTSMASPHAAGTAALVIAAGYATSPADVRQLLQDTADDLGPSGRDDGYGYGLVDAAEAAGNSESGDLPPVVTITSPLQEDVVWDTVQVSADATDDFAVSQVEFFVDGQSIGVDTSVASGWTSSWDTCSWPDGAHNLTATATDDAGQSTPSDGVGVTVDSATKGSCGSVGGEVSLTTTGRKVKGQQKADLEWSGADSTEVDIWRDGSKVTTTPNDGLFTDNINRRGGGSYTYKVCEAGIDTCSNDSTVVF